MKAIAVRRPWRDYGLGLGLLVAALAAILTLPWDLSHLSTSQGRDAAWSRVDSFREGFASPDVTAGTLAVAFDLALETLAIAILGVLLGALLAYPLALVASRAVLNDGTRRSGLSRLLPTFVREAFRGLLDALRGIPDFAWALVLLTIFGPTAITAILAIAIHVAGILGKIASELWDGVPESHGDVLRGTGATRLAAHFYGTQPLAGRNMLSFLLMRFECTVRNASVIGAVCGGGLGARVLQELGYDNKAKAVTFLAATLALTVTADLASNVLRGLLRRERAPEANQARTRRRVAGIVVAALVVASLAWIREPLGNLGAELARLDSTFLVEHYGELLRPDLSLDVLAEALGGMLVPVALGILSTLAAVVLAIVFAYFGSASLQLHSDAFAPEHRPTWLRVLRSLLVGTTRLVTAILRGVPEVAWVWILALFFLTGIEAALCAMILHSAGILARVFTEAVDDIPYARLEHVGTPSRPALFTYGAMQLARTEWKSYALFQFESNVRIGVVLGIIGAGGIGHLFRRALAHGALDRAATFLIGIVLLTTVIDRISRRIQRGPRC